MGIAYALTVLLFITSTKLTTAANAILLQYTAPIYVALLGNWFLKEKARRTDWVALLFIFGGMVLFFFDRLSEQGIWGNILAILSGMTLAWFILSSRKQKNHSPLETVLLGSMLAVPIGVPFVFESLPDLQGWLALLFLGLVQQGVAFVLYSFAVKYVSALETSLILTLEPILNPVWVLFLIGEIPGFWAFIGGLTVLLSIIIRSVILARKV